MFLPTQRCLQIHVSTTKEKSPFNNQLNITPTFQIEDHGCKDIQEISIGIRPSFSDSQDDILNYRKTNVKNRADSCKDMF